MIDHGTLKLPSINHLHRKLIETPEISESQFDSFWEDIELDTNSNIKKCEIMREKESICVILHKYSLLSEDTHKKALQFLLSGTIDSTTIYNPNGIIFSLNAAENNSKTREIIRKSSDVYLMRIERRLRKTINDFCLLPCDTHSFIVSQLHSFSDYIEATHSRIIGQHTIDALAMPMLQLKGKLIEIAGVLEIWKLTDVCQQMINESVNRAQIISSHSRGSENAELSIFAWHRVFAKFMKLLKAILDKAWTEQMRKLLNEAFIADEIWLDLVKSFIMQIFTGSISETEDDPNFNNNKFSLLNVSECPEKLLTQKIQQRLLELNCMGIRAVHFFEAAFKMLLKEASILNLYRKQQSESSLQKYWTESIRHTLNSVSALFNPRFGILTKFLSTNDTNIWRFKFEGVPVTHLLTKQILKLKERFLSFGHRLMKFFSDEWSIFSIRSHYLSFIKLYNKSGLDNKTQEIANSLARHHIGCLLALASHRNEAISRDFFKMRCVEFLTREIDLEFKVSVNSLENQPILSNEKPVDIPEIKLPEKITLEKPNLKLDLSKIGSVKKECEQEKLLLVQPDVNKNNNDYIKHEESNEKIGDQETKLNNKNTTNLAKYKMNTKIELPIMKNYETSLGITKNNSILSNTRMWNNSRLMTDRMKSSIISKSSISISINQPKTSRLMINKSHFLPENPTSEQIAQFYKSNPIPTRNKDILPTIPPKKSHFNIMQAMSRDASKKLIKLKYPPTPQSVKYGKTFSFSDELSKEQNKSKINSAKIKNKNLCLALTKLTMPPPAPSSAKSKANNSVSIQPEVARNIRTLKPSSSQVIKSDEPIVPATPQLNYPKVKVEIKMTYRLLHIPFTPVTKAKKNELLKQIVPPIMLKDLESLKLKIPKKNSTISQSQNSKVIPTETPIPNLNPMVSSVVQNLKEAAQENPAPPKKKPIIPKLSIGGLPAMSHDPNQDLKIGEIPKNFEFFNENVPPIDENLKKTLTEKQRQMEQIKLKLAIQDNIPAEEKIKNFEDSLKNKDNENFMKERTARGIYKDPKLHAFMIGLLFCLLITPKRGTFDDLYCSARPSDEGKSNVLHLLHFHLNHPMNSEILIKLRDLVLKIRPYLCGQRLLKLLCGKFFDPSAYSGWKKIASGAYATVFECNTNLLDPKVVAIKRLSFPPTIYERCVLYDIFNEITALEELRAQKYVTTLFDYGVDDQNYYVVMRRYGNSLREWRLMQNDNFTENLPVYLHIYMEVLKAVDVIHAHNVTHYDLKCDNIMLDLGEHDAEFEVTLGDFGECKLFTSETDEYDLKPRGTECIKSPEMLTLCLNLKKDSDIYDRRKKAGTTRLSDVWSLGCLFYELMTGNYMFNSDDYISFYLHVTNEDTDLLNEEMLAALGGNTYLIDFLKYVLNRSPTRRPSINSVLNRFKHVHALLVNASMSPLICTKSSDDGIGSHFTLEDLLGLCSNMIKNNNEDNKEKIVDLVNENIDHKNTPDVLQIFKNLFVAKDIETALKKKFDLIDKYKITHIVMINEEKSEELKPYFELHISKSCTSSTDSYKMPNSAYYALPGILDFCRNAILHSGNILFISDPAFSINEALLAIVSHVLQTSEYETWTFVKSQTLFFELPKPKLIQLNRWVKYISDIIPFTENYQRYSCICGCCSFALTRPVSEKSKQFTKSCSCSTLFQSTSASSCPGIGCSEHLSSLREKYAVDWDTVSWGFFDAKEDLLIGPEGFGAIKDNLHRKILLYSNGTEENCQLVGVVEKNVSDWSTTRRTEKWSLYKCKFCHMWIYASSLDNSRIALVLNCPRSIFFM